MLKSFKNKRTIRIQSQEATLLMTKSNGIANTSKPNNIKSLKEKFLSHFKSFTRLKSKLILLNYKRN